MEDFEHWYAVGCIEAGQSITDIAVFFGVNHSVISRLMETIPNHMDSCLKARSQSAKDYNPCRRLIYYYFSQAESQSNLHTFEIYGYIVHW